MIKKIFKNRDIVIATKHKKEEVIAPLLKKELALKPFVPKEFDTDFFGTFSGEIERKADALETARLKCLKAMELTGCDLGISNEGSFGTHPQIWFTQADYEIVMLIDKKNGFEFSTLEISTQTNFN